MTNRIYHIILMLFFFGTLAFAQNSLWISGSAVPGGTQKLTKFPTSTSGSYCFKFHGTLIPGTLHVQTTEEISASTRFYAPKLEDSNIVNNGIGYKQVGVADSLSAAWVVLFEADNYRFTVTPSSNTLQGELFNWWYEVYIVGGCVSPNQESKWELEYGQAMVCSEENPYEWTWTGQLKNYPQNIESRRLKIIGQYGWGPKSLNPFTQDSPLLSAKQVWYNASEDNKWVINKDGYYRITCNIFLETIKAEYLGTDPPTDDVAEVKTDISIKVAGRQIQVISGKILTARLFTLSGKQVDANVGQILNLTASNAGIYILHTSDGDRDISRKIIVK